MILTVGFVLWLVVFGWKYHPIPTFGVEIDRYVEKADLLLHGSIPRTDTLHPLFYPIVVAAVGVIVRDTFLAAKLISSLMAGVFVLATYLLGRKIFDRKIAVIGFLFTMTNFHVLAHGVLTSSDMTSSALIMLTLLCVTSLPDARRPARCAIVTGVMFALAYFTRYPAIFLAPTLLLAILWGGRRSAQHRGRLLGIAIISALLALVPYFLLSWQAFSNPVYQENWKNVAFKIYGDQDWSYFAHIPFDGLWSVITHAPEKFLNAGIREVASFLSSGLSGLVGLPPVLAALCFLGGYTTLFHLRKDKLIILSFPVIYTLGVSFSFFTWARGMLPILPFCYLIMAEFLVYFERPVSFRRRTVQPLFLLALGLCVLKIVALTPDIKTFIAWHPIKEVEAAVELERQYGPHIKVMGTCLAYIIQRHVGYAYQELHVDLLKIPRAERRDVAKYYQELDRILKEQQVNYLIVGRMSMERTIPREQHVPSNLLENRDIPSYLTPLRHTAEVTIYAVSHQ